MGDPVVSSVLQSGNAPVGDLADRASVGRLYSVASLAGQLKLGSSASLKDARGQHWLSIDELVSALTTNGPYRGIAPERLKHWIEDENPTACGQLRGAMRLNANADIKLPDASESSHLRSSGRTAAVSARGAASANVIVKRDSPVEVQRAYDKRLRDSVRPVINGFAHGVFDELIGSKVHRFKGEIERIAQNPLRLIKPIDELIASTESSDTRRALATWKSIFTRPPDQWLGAYTEAFKRGPEGKALAAFQHRVAHDHAFQSELAGRGLGMLVEFALTKKLGARFQPAQEIKPIGLKVRQEARELERRHLVRYPETVNEASVKYLEKARSSVEKFDELLWQSPHSTLDADRFTEMQSQLHRIAAYKNEAEAGALRAEGWSAASRRPKLADYVEQIFEKHSGDLGLGSPHEGALPIDHIPESSQPRNSYIRSSRGEHIYPNGGSALKPYFERGAQLLNSIKRGLLGHASPTVVREQIGEYYHVLVNARPFNEVNNSLFMNQVNYLLRLTGHPGLSHGDLDHLLMRVDSGQAKKLWKLALDGKLETASQLRQK